MPLKTQGVNSKSFLFTQEPEEVGVLHLQHERSLSQ